MQTVSAPARKGDLCVLCERMLIIYLDRPAEERLRWRVYRVAATSRGGRVRAVEAQGGQRRRVWGLYFDLSHPLFVAGRDVIDVDAAVEAAWRERPEGFDSLDEAREFLRRFLIEASAKEG